MTQLQTTKSTFGYLNVGDRFLDATRPDSSALWKKIKPIRRKRVRCNAEWGHARRWFNNDHPVLVYCE